MLTAWGESLDPENVLPEYPRPQLVRDSYLNLNGWWRYAITKSAPQAQPPREYDGRILVPFSPEAELSGVGRQLQPHETLWYHRELSLPDGFRSSPEHRVLLHFGAVDQWCRVRVNGRVVAEHVGGYLPFQADVTDALRDGGNDLVVEVRDLSDTGHHSRGKQKLERGGIWYTAQSGIWQTVWVECVPPTYVDRLTLIPYLDDGAVEVTVHSAGRPSDATAHVRVLADGTVAAETHVPAGQTARLSLTDIRPWTPDDPFLYDVEVTLGDDRVTSYVGMRSFGVGPDATGTPRLLLNGEPFLHVGVLDQGYWSDGMYTPPSDEAMVHDIATMKRLGFTMLRKHIKVEPLRWYHHCDRLGMLVWQDMVNGGGPYHRRVVETPAWRPWFHLPDRLPGPWRRLFSRDDAGGREEFERETRDTVELLRNVVSLAVWVPFNEGWGQFDANRIAADVRALDPTRTVDHASGWHDQGGGELRSLHVYMRPFHAPRPRRRLRRDPRVLVLSEYGGYNLRVDGHAFNEEDFGYRAFTDPDALAEAFVRLHEDEITPAVPAGLSAVVYTQVSDVEDELNGLLTYDRRVLKLAEEQVRPVLDKLRAAL